MEVFFFEDRAEKFSSLNTIHTVKENTGEKYSSCGFTTPIKKHCQGQKNWVSCDPHHKEKAGSLECCKKDNRHKVCPKPLNEDLGLKSIRKKKD
jgi:hypothetical protein